MIFIGRCANECFYFTSAEYKVGVRIINRKEIDLNGRGHSIFMLILKK